MQKLLEQIALPRSNKRPSAKVHEFLVHRQVPPQVVEQLVQLHFDAPVQVHQLTLCPFNLLAQQNDAPEHRAALRHGFLTVGHGLAGDPIALELKVRKIAFLDHETCTTVDPALDYFQRSVARTGEKLEAFWLRALRDPARPAGFSAERSAAQ